MAHNTLERLHTYGFARKRLFAVTIIFMISVLILTACGGNNTSSSHTKSGGNINVGLSSDLTTLDPLRSTAFVERQVMSNMYDTLVQVNQQNQLLPDLATSWSYTSPLRVAFTLLTDVKFQDGTPFNADAVVFNINRILSTPSSPRYSELTSVKSVQAIDDSHVVFNLKTPFSPLVSTLAFYSGMMLSPTAVKKLGANFGSNPVGAGTGPFMFSNWVRGDHLTIKKNPYYWQKDAQGNALPYLDSVTYHPITNGNTMYANLQTGTIQVADSVDPNDIANAKSTPNLIYNQMPGLSFYGFALNTKAAPFNNVHVRRAIQYGVNRQEILNAVLKGAGVVANGPIPTSSWAYDKNFVPYTYDINKAKAELALVGNPHGISFTLLIASGSPLYAQEAQFIQAELQPVGITVQIKPETAASVFTDAATYNFQAAMLFYSGRPDPDGNMYYYFHTGGGYNCMQYSNPQVDSLLEAARASNNQQVRTADYQKAQQIIMQDAPWVFIDHGVAVQATTTNVQNFTLRQTNIMNFAQVYLNS
jgi:peptide/nickel transport system substrate-binding protein